MYPLRKTGTGRSLALTALVGTAFLAGCAGDNLFSLSAAVGAQGPSVEITEPTEGTTVAPGASIQVAATAEAPDGITLVKFSGVFKDSEEPAFASAEQTLQSVPIANLTQTLGAIAGGEEGIALIIVDVTDAFGEVAADTVTITVG